MFRCVKSFTMASSTNDSLSRVLTLVFTDLADSTALKTERGDQASGDLISRHREHVTQLAERCDGRIIDWAGDGCFLTFETSSGAVTFALRLQQIHHYESDLPGVRVGMHMGEVTEKSGPGDAPRIEGLAVDLSARVSGLAQPGQVLLSSAVHQSAKQRIGIHEFGQPIRWETHGPYTLKGFDEAMDVREAGLEGLSPFTKPEASEKAWPSDQGKQGEGSAADAPIRKLAVLPLENISGDPEQEYFVDGMTEAIITELAKIKALRVISRTSVMQYRNTTKKLSTVAKELGVDALVEGSVVRAGDQVRITAQLIRGATDEYLWADSYDGSIEDILKLQKDVALSIADEIKIAVSYEERSRLETETKIDPEVYDLLLKAEHALFSVSNDTVRETRQYLHQANAIDSNVAKTHAMLVSVRWLGTTYGHVRTVDVMPSVSRSARKALRLDDSEAEAHAALGLTALAYEWDWEEAEYRFNRALELDVNKQWGYGGLTYLYCSQGRFDEAYEINRKHTQLDPRAAFPLQNLCLIHLLNRNGAESAEAARVAIRHSPDQIGAYIDGACGAMLAEDYALAVERLDHVIGVDGRVPLFLALRGYATGLAGDFAVAEQVLAELLERAEKEFVLSHALVLLYSTLGRLDDALEALEQSFLDRDWQMIWLQTTHLYDPLRDDPRFQDILRRMNFPEMGTTND